MRLTRSAALAPCPGAAPQTGAHAQVSPVKFLLVVQVWGTAFTELFTELMLASLNTPGNLGAIHPDSELLVYTRREDIPLIRGSASFVAAGRFVRTEFQVIDDLLESSAHMAMSECQRRAAERAMKHDLPVIFLAPDTVMSSRMLERISDRWREGYRAVMIASVRVAKESFLPAIRDTYGTDDGELDLEPRDLVRIMTQHLHPISSCLLWDSLTFSPHPSHLYWRVGDDGLFAVCAHIHPIMVHAVERLGDFDSTIDDDYVPTVVPDPDRIHVVTDSDEMVIVEMSSASHLIHSIEPRRRDLDEIAIWVEQFANPLHRRFFEHDIYLHAEELGPEWTSVQATARWARDSILRRLQRAPLTLLIASPKTFAARFSRYGRRPQDLIEDLARRFSDRKADGSERSPLSRASVAIARWATEAVWHAAAAFYTLYVSGARLATNLYLWVYFALARNAVGPNFLHHAWLESKEVGDALRRALWKRSGRVLIAGSDYFYLENMVLTDGVSRDFERVSTIPGERVQHLFDTKDWPVCREGYDVVVCYDFLAHFENPSRITRHLLDSVKPGGYLIMMAPFFKCRTLLGYDYYRFTTDGLRHLVESAAAENGTPVTIDGMECIGGIGTAFASLLLTSPHYLTRTIFLGRLLKFLLLPVFIAMTLAANGFLYLCNRLDGTKLFYSHALVTFVKDQQAEDDENPC